MFAILFCIFCLLLFYIYAIKNFDLIFSPYVLIVDMQLNIWNRIGHVAYVYSIDQVDLSK